MDAAATLAKLTVGSEITRAAFQREIGSVVREAVERARPVCAYGEIVDLLWQAGDVGLALELERLWNELIGELGFSLLCAYHSAAVQAPEHEHALRDVCRLHSSVSSEPFEETDVQENRPANERWREFQPDDDAPAAARRFLDETLQRWGDRETAVDDTHLLLTELVTNAVVHAQSSLVVSIRRQASKVRLAVHAKSPAKPTVRAQTSGAPWGGWGLPIVAALSSDWGVEATSDGKTVWASSSGPPATVSPSDHHQRAAALVGCTRSADRAVRRCVARSVPRTCPEEKKSDSQTAKSRDNAGREQTATCSSRRKAGQSRPSGAWSRKSPRVQPARAGDEHDSSCVMLAAQTGAFARTAPEYRGEGKAGLG